MDARALAPAILHRSSRYRNGLDLSLSGALVRAPYDRSLTIECKSWLRRPRGAPLAQVRRINSDTDLHGAFFDTPLFEFFNETLAAR